MWKAQRRTIRDGWGETIALSQERAVMAVRDVIAGWRNNAPFRAWFIAELAATSHPAFFWELPPVQPGTLSQPFECAVIRSDALAGLRADESDFADQLRGDAPVAVFPNLGGDALLIAPRRMTDADCYAHIAAFFRSAPHEQQHALFRCLAMEVEKRLAKSSDRFWISTSGLGVPWVHVRLDSYPKYYQHRPYVV
jgi:hypothetical protein